MLDLVTAGLTHLAHTTPSHASVAGGLQVLGVSVFGFLMLGIGGYAWFSARESEKHQNKLLRGAMWMFVLAAIGVAGAIVTFVTNNYHVGSSGFAGLFGVGWNTFLFLVGLVAVVELFKRAHILKGEVPNWGPALAFGTPLILLLGPLESVIVATSAGLASGTSPLTSWLGT